MLGIEATYYLPCAFVLLQYLLLLQTYPPSVAH
jgi:hypothetical protein